MRPQHDAPGDDDFEILPDRNKPVVADGTYDSIYIGYETGFCFRAGKVFVWFRIVSPGDYNGIELYRSYNAKEVSRPFGKGGRFRPAARSDLVVDLYRLLDIKQRRDRISLHSLKDRIWRIRTRTVITDWKQREVPEFLRYSVIDQIVKAVA